MLSNQSEILEEVKEPVEDHVEVNETPKRMQEI